jgi:hypothetical protein
MKRIHRILIKLITKILLLLTGILFSMWIGTQIARADSEPIDLIPIPTATPEPIPDPRPIVVRDHDIDEKDVELIARLLWSSPLQFADYKRGLVFVVMNRALYGAPFGSSIKEVINKHEFTFFDKRAHISTDNKFIAREAMNTWLTRKEGENVGEQIPLNAYYIRFFGTDNRRLQLLDIDKNPLDWDPIN